MKKGFVFLSLCIGLMFFMGDAWQVFAQEDKTDEFTLEEITVTAAKRGEENLQKVALSMEVISDKDLAAEGKTNVDEILTGLSNVFINTSSDGMRISIRGVADTDPVMGGRKSSSPTVAMNVDGSYNSMNNAGQNLFDIERIEVLMGPQSTLYAANSPGGIVNIITAAPKTDRFSANASVEYGNYNHSNLQVALNAPIVKEKVAMRLALSRAREDSFTDSSTLATKSDAARLKALWQANDYLSISAIGNWSKNGNGGMMGGAVKPFIESSDSAWTPATNAGGGNSADQTTKSLSGTISWDNPVGNLSVTPNSSKSSSEGYQYGALPGPPGQAATYATSYNIMRTSQKGVDARIASSADFTLLKYVVGYTYFKMDFKNSADYEGALSVNNSWSTNKQKQSAIYANITYPLWFHEKLAVTVGYRKSQDVTELHSYEPGRGADNPVPMDYSKPDLKFGFEYNLNDNMMFYGSYAGSYRTDGMAMTNNLGTRPPEELKAYTIGAKTRLLDNTLQVNSSAYYYDYKNKFAQDTMSQVQVSLAQLPEEERALVDTSRGPASTVDGVDYYNVQDGGFNGWGDARTIGVDASATWLASANDMVDFSVSYLDMKWSRLSFIYVFHSLFQDHNYDGRQAPNAPKWSMSGSYEHNFDLASYGTLTPHIEMQFKSKTDLVFDQVDDPGYGRQEAYFLWNASVAYNSNGVWSVNAFVKNIANYAVKRSFQKNNNDPTAATMMIGDPRTYGATLTVKF
jgi:iron complex outermembrane recepter protein